MHFTLRSTIDSSTIAFLASGDSTSIEFPILQQVYGLADATAWTSLSDDEEPSNDTLHAFVLNPIPKDSLSITEIMFRPDVGSCEWIELYNHSSQPIALDSCYLLRESATTSSTSRF